MNGFMIINMVLVILFAVFTGYQAVFAILKLLRKKQQFCATAEMRYAVIIAARNESAVIGQLIDSIKKQDYPAKLVDIFVVADNCTDNTAEIAKKTGAIVYERFNNQLIGKGYALNFLFQQIETDQGIESYDGFFVFDADNLLDTHYITEMNKVFSNGYKAVTSYRNTKNYGDNWISAGYGLWFLREAEYLNRPRAYLGSSCMLSGTGFVFSSELLAEKNGWNYFLLSEDSEFTADLITKGEVVGYCSSAIYYDEQPTELGASITQRSRWIKGSMQVLSAYGLKALKNFFKKGNMSCYDLLFSVLSTIVLTVVAVILNGFMALVTLADTPTALPMLLQNLAFSLLMGYLGLYLTGMLPLITEWKQIYCPAYKKILYSFAYPIFMLTFLIALVPAVFTNVSWKPIRHARDVSITDLKGS